VARPLSPDLGLPDVSDEVAEGEDGALGVGAVAGAQQPRRFRRNRRLGPPPLLGVAMVGAMQEANAEELGLAEDLDKDVRSPDGCDDALAHPLILRTRKAATRLLVTLSLFLNASW